MSAVKRVDFEAPSLPRAVIVHSGAQAGRVVALGLGVTLASPAGAGAYAGVGWWREVMAAARSICPAATFADILDCGISPGHALGALRGGQKYLVLACEARIFARIGAQAAEAGGFVWALMPPALDFGRKTDENQVISWLTS